MAGGGAIRGVVGGQQLADQRVAPHAAKLRGSMPGGGVVGGAGGDERMQRARQAASLTRAAAARQHQALWAHQQYRGQRAGCQQQQQQLLGRPVQGGRAASYVVWQGGGKRCTADHRRHRPHLVLCASSTARCAAPVREAPAGNSILPAAQAVPCRCAHGAIEGCIGECMNGAPRAGSQAWMRCAVHVGSGARSAHSSSDADADADADGHGSPR
jgi:hypothetical protein